MCDVCVGVVHSVRVLCMQCVWDVCGVCVLYVVVGVRTRVAYMMCTCGACVDCVCVVCVGCMCVLGTSDVCVTCAWVVRGM